MPIFIFSKTSFNITVDAFNADVWMVFSCTCWGSVWMLWSATITITIEITRHIYPCPVNRQVILIKRELSLLSFWAHVFNNFGYSFVYFRNNFMDAKTFICSKNVVADLLLERNRQMSWFWGKSRLILSLKGIVFWCQHTFILEWGYLESGVVIITVQFWKLLV